MYLHYIHKKIYFCIFAFSTNFSALGMTLFGLLAIIITLFLAGLAIFAVYAGCDPITLGNVERKDQMLPFYVMQNLGFMSGVPGVFVACLFSGTMRCVSKERNTNRTVHTKVAVAVAPVRGCHVRYSLPFARRRRAVG